MPKRTIRCPSGCPEEYLERLPWRGVDKGSPISQAHRSQLRGTGTHYICEECDWEAVWLPGKGLLTLVDPNPEAFADGVDDEDGT